jgi:hypothetical protein
MSPRPSSAAAPGPRRRAARAGGQQPDRNGRGVHARRIRCLRRAHDRHSERAACSWARFHGWWPAADSRTAMCWAPARAGQSPFCSTARAREEFAASSRARHLHLGVCNGCQMLSALKELIPGAHGWPRFVRNRSEQYEARLSWCACRSRTRCCSPACTARCCRSRWRTAKVRRSSTGRRAPQLLRAAMVTLQYVDNARAADRAAIPSIRTARLGLAGCAAPTAASLRSCRIRSACSARCRTPGRPRSGRRTAAGCACSATRGCSWRPIRRRAHPT